MQSKRRSRGIGSKQKKRECSQRGEAEMLVQNRKNVNAVKGEKQRHWFKTEKTGMQSRKGAAYNSLLSRERTAGERRRS